MKNTALKDRDFKAVFLSINITYLLLCFSKWFKMLLYYVL